MDDNRSDVPGVICAAWGDYEGNREAAYFELDVAPQARRQKIGAALAVAGVEFAGEHDRTLINFDANNHVPAGSEFLKSIGAEAGHISDLTAQISALEGKADEMHDEGLHTLLRASAAGGSGLDFFVGNEGYDHREKVGDVFQEGADAMPDNRIQHV